MNSERRRDRTSGYRGRVMSSSASASDAIAKIDDADPKDRAAFDATPLMLAAIVAVVMSSTIGAISWYWRRQMGDDCAGVILSLVALTGTLVFLPLWAQVSRFSVGVTAALAVGLPLATIAAVLLAGHFTVASILVYVLFAACWLLGAKTIVSSEVSALQSLLAVLLGAALGILNFFVINQVGTSTVFAPEAALVGLGHIDSLFHSAIAAMLVQYGIVSTGLDGFVSLNYHVFSHLLIGHLASWLNVPTINIYAVIMLVLGAPLLLFSTAFAIFALWRPTAKVRSPLNILLIPLAAFSLFEIKDWYSYLASESYLLALVLFLLSFPVLVLLAEGKSNSAVVRSLVTALAVAPFIAFAKVSVGIVFCGAIVTALALRIFSKWQFRSLVSVALLLAAGFVLWLALAPLDWENSGFKFVSFFRAYREVAVLNFAVAVLGIGFLSLRKPRDTANTRTMFFFAILASIYPTFVLEIAAGAEYYFINVGVWIAIVAMSGYFILPTVSQFRYPVRGLVVLPGLAATIVFVLATVETPGKGDSVGKFLKYSAGLVMAANPAREAKEINSLADAANVLRRFAREDLNETYASRVLNGVRSGLGDDRRDAAVFVSPRATRFWHLQPLCRSDGFMVPAFLGVPMVLGVTADCDDMRGYGFPQYGKMSRNRVADDDELCRSGQAIRLGRVIRVDDDNATRVVQCRRPNDAIPR